MSAQLLVRTSERTSYLRCRWAWDRSYNDGLKPRHAAIPLRFGTLIHGAMEKYYKVGRERGPLPHKTFKRLYDKSLKEAEAFGMKDNDGVWHDAGELGVAMLKSYIEEFGDDSDIDVLATEQPFQTPVLNSKGAYLFTYVGVFDGVWRERSTKKIWIPDYKSVASIPKDSQWMDEQAGSYWAFGVPWLYQQKILKPKQQLSGLRFIFLRKALPDDRPTNAAGHCLNQDGSVSKSQPAPYFEVRPVRRSQIDSDSLRTRVIQQVREMRKVRKGELEAYKNPGPMYNPNCRGCGYRDICELHERGEDYSELIKPLFVKWDPYAEHEVYLAETNS